MKPTAHLKSILIFTGVFGVIFFSQIKSAASVEEVSNAKKVASSAKWSEKMQDLYKTLADLLTDISSEKRFYDRANNYRIENNTKKLSILAHELKKKETVSPDSDPTVQILSGLFADETQHAYQELKRGHRVYARSILRSVSGYCIACHTRNGSGPSFGKLAFEPTSKEMKSIERGEFFTATRQFDRAETEFKKVIQEQSGSVNRPLEWEKAVQYSLAIAVRVKQDPELALTLVKMALKLENVPFSFRKNAEYWRKSLEEWKNETPKNALDEESLHNDAIRLLAQARELQKYPLDHSADILYLRATAVLHSLLQLSPNGRYATEAFLLAGLCYEVLGPLNLFNFHELYYIACIQKSPRTPTSETCYRRYEESIFTSYTGSRGTSIPSDVRERLFKLELMAHPQDQIPKPIQK